MIAASRRRPKRASCAHAKNSCPEQEIRPIRMAAAEPQTGTQGTRCHREERVFFFEKKKQKTFATLSVPCARAALHAKKSFCFFFFRKRRAFWQSRVAYAEWPNVFPDDRMNFGFRTRERDRQHNTNQCQPITLWRVRPGWSAGFPHHARRTHPAPPAQTTGPGGGDAAHRQRQPRKGRHRSVHPAATPASPRA